jgi:hypothetical protein
MQQVRLARAIVAGALLVVSCGGGGQAPGGGGGRGGSGPTGGAGGQAGGAGTGGACVPVAACGGDVVGTWRVVSSCLTATKDLSSVCAGASADVAYAITGSVTYDADGTYTPSLAATTTVHEHYPAGCAPFGLTCDQLGRVAMDAGPPVMSAGCTTDATGACTCASVVAATVDNTPGTYTASGTTLASVQGSTTSTSMYCVQAGLLHETPAPGDGGLTAMGEIVLAKP